MPENRRFLLPIVAGMSAYRGGMEITFDEGIRRVKAEGASFQEKTADAVKKMWEIVQPGVAQYAFARKYNPAFHPKNLERVESASARDAFLYSSCGAIHSVTALLLANAGVQNLHMLRCNIALSGGGFEGHVNTVLGPGGDEDLPHGAMLSIDRAGLPHWCPLEPGDFERIERSEDKILFEKDRAGEVLKEVRPPSNDFGI